jgi:integrase
MAKAKGLTPIGVQNAKARVRNGQPILTEISDTGSKGLRLVVHPTGHKSWIVRYRHAGKSKKLTLGSAVTLDKGQANPMQVLTLAVARIKAAEAQGQIAQRIDPRTEKQEAEGTAKTFQKAAEECFTQAKAEGLRSAERSLDDLRRLAFAKLGSRSIESINRSEVMRLLEQIAKEKGPVMADAVLSAMSKVFNYWTLWSDNDDFRSPLVKGMRRTKSKERARSRILLDDELAKVWSTADEDGAFGAFIQLLILTAARRNEAARMTWAELSNGNWCLPPARNKAKVELCRPLSRKAQEVLGRLPARTADTDFVFRDMDGRVIFSNLGTLKKKFDARCGVRGWRLHDLRRTSKTLMSRAGVQREHSEKCLGHLIGGVEATYDRHAYQAEMLAAYEKLASLIERIVHPQPNVVPLHA